MYMIRDASGTVTFAIGIAGYGGEIGVERGTNGGIEDGSTVFGAEDNVDEKERKRLRHGGDPINESGFPQGQRPVVIPVVLGPKARLHPSLGHRPRKMPA